MHGVRWDRVYGTNLDQAGLSWAKLDQLGQVGRHFAVFRLLKKALLTKLDQVGPVLFPTVFRALPKNTQQSKEIRKRKKQGNLKKQDAKSPGKVKETIHKSFLESGQATRREKAQRP